MDRRKKKRLKVQIAVVACGLVVTAVLGFMLPKVTSNSVSGVQVDDSVIADRFEESLHMALMDHRAEQSADLMSDSEGSDGSEVAIADEVVPLAAGESTMVWLDAEALFEMAMDGVSEEEEAAIKALFTGNLPEDEAGVAMEVYYDYISLIQ